VLGTAIGIGVGGAAATGRLPASTGSAPPVTEQVPARAEPPG
jgi:hypothetical protein